MKGYVTKVAAGGGGKEEKANPLKRGGRMNGGLEVLIFLGEGKSRIEEGTWRRKVP